MLQKVLIELCDYAVQECNVVFGSSSNRLLILPSSNDCRNGAVDHRYVEAARLTVQIISTVFELPRGLGVEPSTSSCRPRIPLVKIRPRGSSLNPPHLSFAKVGMLLDSHFLLMQFLKYLQCDDLNVTTILIHIED